MEVDGGVASAARRRRERRLGSWCKHEQQTVRMVLSAAVHHSFDKVAAGEKYQRPRGQKTDRAGVRPEPLDEVSESQVQAATVGYVAAAGAPLLAVPSLGGGAAIDDTSAHFLLEMALLSPVKVEQLRRAERRKLAREREEKEREKAAHGVNMSSRPSAWPCPPAVHHSFDKVAAGEKYYAPRGQKTDRAGVRPEPLEEVSAAARASHAKSNSPPFFSFSFFIFHFSFFSVFLFFFDFDFFCFFYF